MKSAVLLLILSAGVLTILPPFTHAAPLEDAMELCRHATDANQKISSCSAVIAYSRDRKVLARAYNTRGLALCDLDRCAEAIADFTYVVQLNPSIPGFFANRARALRAAGRFAEAMNNLEHAIDMAPTCAFLYMNKAETLEEAGRYGEALAVVDQAIPLRPVDTRICPPPDAGAWEYRGKILGEMGRYSEAYGSYEHALSLQPDRWSVYRTRAETLLAQGRLGDAILDLQRYPDYAPNFADAEARIAAIRSDQQAELNRKMEQQRQLAAAQEAARMAEREQQMELVRQAERSRQAEQRQREAEAKAEQWRLEADRRQSADENATRLAILHAQAEKAQAEADLARAQAAKAQADLARVEAERQAAEADLARVRAAAHRDAEQIKADIAGRDKSNEVAGTVK